MIRLQHVLPALASVLPAVALMAMPAAAQTAVSTQSAVYVERTEANDVRRLEPAKRLAHGDRVVTVVSWTRANSQGGNGSTNGFVITNPMPAALSYEESAQDGQEVSVDGGRTWGKLGTLRIAGRLATADDVTTVRWRIPPKSAARGRGELAYAGVVR